MPPLRRHPCHLREFQRIAGRDWGGGELKSPPRSAVGESAFVYDDGKKTRSGVAGATAANFAVERRLG